MRNAVKFLVVALAAMPVSAMPVIEFAPSPANAGNWTYNAATSILSFDQDVVVNQAASSNSDPLVGAKVYLPALRVSGFAGNYTLTPVGSPYLRITDPSGTQTYLSGTLGAGDLTAVGTIAGGYTRFQTDVTEITISPQGAALGSTAIELIGHMSHPSLDLQFSLDGGNGAHFASFRQMIDGGFSGTSGFSGALSVPEPTTLALLGMGGLTLARRYRKTSRR